MTTKAEREAYQALAKLGVPIPPNEIDAVLEAAEGARGPNDRESGWVIERFLFSELHYWTGDVFSLAVDGDLFSRRYLDAGFKTDPNAALRFSRRQDAAMILRRLLADNGRVAEHIWLGKEKA